jgi:single-strand DNA-binding protein
MNKVFLIGRLVKDPEVRTTSTGKKVASFSIAISDGKDQSGQEITQYFNGSAWERLAEIIEMYVKKGTKVAIFGSLKNRSWDAPDGTKRYATDILAREMEILSSKNESSGDSGNADFGSNSTPSESSPAPKKSATAKDEKDELPEIDVNDINIQMPF